MVLTGASISGLVIMIIGIIGVIVGIVLYEINVQNKKPQGWWVWLLIGLGVLLSVVGAVMTIIFMSKVPKGPTNTPAMTMYPDQTMNT